MANVIFTNKCNIQCPFCFASENNAKDNKETEMFSFADTWNLTNFLSKGIPFKFCGGEPTLNPDIIQTLELLLKSNWDITLLTNGIWPERFQQYINNLPPKYIFRVSYLFNVLEPSFYPNIKLSKLHKTLGSINPTAASLGFTIYKKNFEYMYLLELAKKYNIKRIRWSIAAPNIEGPKYRLENDFEEIASRFYDFMCLAVKWGIDVGGDCGYIPPCYFEDSQFKELSLLTNNSRDFNRFSCANSPIDIDNKGNSWRCYGLYALLKKSINNFNSEEELRGYFNRRIKLLQNLRAYEKCKTCKYLNKSCSGGCYAIRVKKALEIDKEICFFPIDDDDKILNCKPQKINNLVVKGNGADSKYIVYNRKIVENPDENMLSFIEEIDGEKTVGQLIEMWKENFDSYQIARDTIVEMCRKVFEMDMVTINYDYGIEFEQSENWR